MRKRSKILLGLGSIATLTGTAILIRKAILNKQIRDLTYEPEIPDTMKYSKNNFITTLQDQGILLYMDYPDYEGIGKKRKVLDAASYYLDKDNNNLGAIFCRVFHNSETDMYETSLEIDGTTYYFCGDTENEAYGWLYKAIFETEDEDTLWVGETECEDA